MRQWWFVRLSGSVQNVRTVIMRSRTEYTDLNGFDCDHLANHWFRTSITGPSAQYEAPHGKINPDSRCGYLSDTCVQNLMRKASHQYYNNVGWNLAKFRIILAYIGLANRFDKKLHCLVFMVVISGTEDIPMYFINWLSLY